MIIVQEGNKELFSGLSANVGEGLGTGLGRFAVFFSFFASRTSLFSFVFFDAAELVDEAHLTGKERVTLGADIDRNGIAGRASLERVAAAAGNRDLVVFGMNIGFHGGYSIRKIYFFLVSER